ncbi:hemerythrin domain-containing protein [Gracilibacillus phocaeensis]|uniref:hemerythrin domain-containing protein n=1 Tax=Gracilibacillus phocaeensis TaxID=2042304 RepID=UPI00102FCDE5|nr:hemerythrin domain-containing protein [Gracilibacillus phocaeensis]
MKRHEALNPLSHHHHHTLTQALELQRAGTEKSQKGYTELLRDLIEFWEKDGNDHFRDEEEVLIPLYLEHADSIEMDLVKEILYQHAQIRSSIQHLREDRQTSYKEMNELGELLNNHVRLEERQLFPLIEQAVPEKYLYQANGRFHRDSHSGF